MAFELKAELRDITGKKVSVLRSAGLVPAEVYGKGVSNSTIQIDEKTLRQVLHEAGNTNLIGIKIGRKKAVNTLARDIQYSPIKHNILHVDFYAVNMAETVVVSVPIQLLGEAPAIKEGGVLVSGINELEIEALPGDLPETINVDVTGLENFGDAIHVNSLSLPENIAVLSSPDSLIVSAQAPRVAEVEEVEEVEEGEEIVSEVDEEETEE